MSGYDPILLDLDGTVIDSVALIRESHRHAVRTVLGEDWEDDRLVANVGRPLIEQMAVFAPDRADELYAVYREWNHANTAALLLAYEGIEDALRELRSEGPLAIVTSKSHDAVDLAWGVLPSLRDLFDVVIAAEDTERHKPEPDPLLEALRASARGWRAPATSATPPSTSSPAGPPASRRSASPGASSLPHQLRPRSPTRWSTPPTSWCALCREGLG